MAPVLALVPDWQDQPFDRLVALLRVVNALLLAPLPLLGFALARRVGLAEPVAVAAAAVPLAVPQLYHIGSSVNNDNLLLPLLAGTFVVAASVGRGDLRLRTAGRLGALTGLCLLTKGLALFLPLLVALAYAVGASRAGLRRSVLPAVTALGTGFGIGGWWWVHNKLAYGTFQPDGTKLVQPKLVAHTSWAQTGGEWLGQFSWLMNRRFWLDPGSTAVPHLTDVAAAVAAALVVAGVGLSVLTRTPRWRDALLLALPLACIAGIVGYGSWETWEKVIRASGMQGRYLYGALPGLAVLVVAGAGRLLGRRRAVLPLLVLLLAAAMQAVALRLTLPIYWLPETGSGPARLLGGIEALLAWSAWPPAVVVAARGSAPLRRSAAPRTADRRPWFPPLARSGAWAPLCSLPVTYDLPAQQAELVALRVGQHVPGLGPGLSDLDGPGAEREQPGQLGGLVPVGRVDVQVQPQLLPLGLGAQAEDQRRLRPAEAGPGPDLHPVVGPAQLHVVEHLRPERGQPVGVRAVQHQLGDPARHRQTVRDAARSRTTEMPSARPAAPPADPRSEGGEDRLRARHGGDLVPDPAGGRGEGRLGEQPAGGRADRVRRRPRPAQDQGRPALRGRGVVELVAPARQEELREPEAVAREHGGGAPCETTAVHSGSSGPCGTYPSTRTLGGCGPRTAGSTSGPTPTTTLTGRSRSPASAASKAPGCLPRIVPRVRCTVCRCGSAATRSASPGAGVSSPGAGRSGRTS